MMINRRHIILKVLYGLWPMMVYAAATTTVIVYCWSIGRLPTWTLVLYMVTAMVLGTATLVDNYYWYVKEYYRKIK